MKLPFARRSPTRIPRTHEFWDGKRIPFTRETLLALVMLQLLFLGLLSYVYGSLFHQASRVHNFKVLYVDFDGGVIGKSVPAAYEELQAADFPTLVQRSTEQYATPADVRKAVCGGNYWGGVYTHSGASSRLSAALGGGEAATAYDAEDTFTYIYNVARYPAFAEGLVESNLVELGSVTRVAYNELNGTQALSSLNTSSTAAVQALLNPIQAASDNIQPTSQGPRVLYNTLSMVMPMIMQFFFVMAINHVSSDFRLLSKLPRLENYVIRLFLSLLFTAVGALCMAGYIWAFREEWAVTSTDFALTWLTLWLYMHINFYIFDVATAFIPIHLIAFWVLFWILLNVTSSIAPFEVVPGFYHWSYALPTHEVYQLLVQIWSEGCAVQEYRALPILFSWWLVGNIASVFALRHRCGVSAAEEEAERIMWEERIRGTDDHKHYRPDTRGSETATEVELEHRRPRTRGSETATEVDLESPVPMTDEQAQEWKKHGAELQNLQNIRMMDFRS